jgi:hypothetical protein
MPGEGQAPLLHIDGGVVVTAARSNRWLEMGFTMRSKLDLPPCSDREPHAACSSSFTCLAIVATIFI